MAPWRPVQGSSDTTPAAIGRPGPSCGAGSGRSCSAMPYYPGACVHAHRVRCRAGGLSGVPRHSAAPAATAADGDIGRRCGGCRRCIGAIRQGSAGSARAGSATGTDHHRDDGASGRQGSSRARARGGMLGHRDASRKMHPIPPSPGRAHRPPVSPGTAGQRPRPRCTSCPRAATGSRLALTVRKHGQVHPADQPRSTWRTARAAGR